MDWRQSEESAKRMSDQGIASRQSECQVPPAFASGRAHPLGAWSFFVTLLLAVIVLQRIVVPGLDLDVILLTLAVGLAVFFLVGEMQVSFVRMALFSAFVVSACLSAVLAGPNISAPSLALLLAAYSIFIVKLNVTRCFYLRCLGFFVDVMTALAFVTMIQVGGQLATGAVVIPSMDDLLPPDFIIKGFVYWQPLYWGSNVVKPPAFFFREVSFVSQFLALAIVAEALFFRRVWRLLVLIAAIFATFAGTGFIILGLTLPFVLAKLPMRMKLAAIPLAAVIAFAAISSGWFSNVESRLDEYKSADSSTYGRFIYPLLALSQLETFDNPLFTGLGPGNADRISQGRGVVLAPAKLAIEYGIVPAVLFYVFFIYCLFHRAPDASFSIALLSLHIFGGGYLLSSPIFVIIFLLGALFRVSEQRASPPPKNVSKWRQIYHGANWN